MNQLSLPIRTPASRTSDNAASKHAEKMQNDSGLRDSDAAAVLRGFCAHSGCTTKELSALTGLDRHLVGKRAPDLLRNKLLNRAEGSDGWRWYPTEAGKALVRKWERG